MTILKEGFRAAVEATEATIVGSYPNETIPIFVKRLNMIARKPPFAVVTGIDFVGFDRITVVDVQSFFSTKPQIPFGILQHAQHVGMRQALALTNIPELNVV